MERLTWKRCLDGYEDVGLKNGVTVGDAVLRLSEYEDTMRTPEELKKLIAPSNDPLTLEELREMDGEPVYCTFKSDGSELGWGIVRIDGDDYEAHLNRDVKIALNSIVLICERYDETVHGFWAYRRKPSENS